MSKPKLVSANYDLLCRIHDIRTTISEQRALLDTVEQQLQDLLNVIRERP